MDRQRAKGEHFRALHEGEPFVIPNPWDAGSARVLEGLGFKALATTSSGFAFTLGRLDGGVTLEEVAAHVAALDQATDLPDLGRSRERLRRRARAMPRRAVAALRTQAPSAARSRTTSGRRLYGFDLAVERVAAAVEAARALSFPSRSPLEPRTTSAATRISTTRSRGCRRSRQRARTSSTHPGSRRWKTSARVCDAVSKPVNVLARPQLTFGEIAGAGAQRVSVGGSLTWTSVDALVTAAEAIRDRGDFSVLRPAPPLADWF